MKQHTVLQDLFGLSGNLPASILCLRSFLEGQQQEQKKMKARARYVNQEHTPKERPSIF